MVSQRECVGAAVGNFPNSEIRLAPTKGFSSHLNVRIFGGKIVCARKANRLCPIEQRSMNELMSNTPITNVGGI